MLRPWMAFSAFLFGASASAGEIEEEIRRLEKQLSTAVVKGDVSAFDRLFAEDFTHGSHSGRFRTKAEWLKGRVQGRSAYLSLDSTSVRIRALGQTALVNGIAQPRWREGDQIASGQYRFLRVWAKRNGKWKVVAFQSTRLPTKTTKKLQPEAALNQKEPPATRELSIKEDRPYLDGKKIEIWGLRCGNAIYSQGVTERHVRNLDNMVAHGINCIGVYIQGSNGGHPNPEGGRNGFTPEGRLKPGFARRLEWLIREADHRGMVVMVGLFSPRKDQELKGERAIQRACEETAKFLVKRKLRNVFCDLVHEYSHSRVEQELFREPHGSEKKAKLTQWFKSHAPKIEVGICPTFKSKSRDAYPGMDVRIIQKEHPIPKTGFVVNVETQRHDAYSNDGKFEADEFPIFLRNFKEYAEAPNACMLFHSGWCQGMTNGSGTGPNPEMGGYGRSEEDRGIRFYYEWVRDHIGRYEYPRHIKKTKPLPGGAK